MLRRLLSAIFLTLPLAAQNGGAIEGVVLNPNTGAGVPGVSVVLYTRQAVRYEVTTDASGAFRATDMAPGAYEVRFGKDGYTAGRREPPQPYAVAAGQKPIKVRLEMTRQAVVSGRVVDRDGNPAANVRVKLGDLPVAPVTARGEFRFTEVPPGYYTLLAIPQSAKPVNAAKPDEVRVDRVPTYYPSSNDAEGAGRIVVRGDADLSDLEIQMRTDAVHSMRGIVLNESGERVPGARVSLLAVARQRARVLTNVDGAYLTIAGNGPGTGAEVAQTTTDADGSFSFDAVPTGDWVIAATLSGSIESADFVRSFRSGSISTTVGRADVDNLRVSMGAPFTLTGTSEWRHIPTGRAMVQLSPAYAGSGFGGFSGPPPTPGRSPNQPDGSFTLSVRPSRYYVLPLCFVACYPVSVLLAGQEVLGQAVDLVSSSQSLHVVYKAASGVLRGMVDAASTILLIPDQITSLGFGRIERAKPDGTFEVTGIVPGTYAVAALTGLPQAGRLDSDVLERVLSIGARVSVQEGSPASVNLSAVPWLQ